MLRTIIILATLLFQTTFALQGVVLLPLTLEWPMDDEKLPLMIALTADTAQVEIREPIQVMYVMDISEVLAGTVLQEMTAGGQKILSQLRPGDLFGCVVYSDHARTYIPMTPVTDESRERMMTLMGTVLTENGRNLSRGLDRALVEMNLLKGRRNAGIFTIITTLGAITSGDSGEKLLQKISTYANATQSRVYTVGFNDRLQQFDADVALRAARNSGGRAHFAPYDNPKKLASIFNQLALEISQQSSLDIELTLAATNTTTLALLGSNEKLPETISLKGLARGQTRYIFLNLSPKPSESVDIDVDISRYVINTRATQTDHGSANVRLSRTATPNYTPLAAPHILRYTILQKLAASLPDLLRGDKEYRKAFAEGYRTMLITKLNPIRAEIDTPEMQRTYNDLMGLYDVLIGGTSSSDLINKAVLYELYDSEFGYLYGDY